MQIRRGGPDDVPAMLGMLDSAVEWLVARGRTGQWGTEPWSTREGLPERVAGYVRDGETWIAELDGVPAGAMVLLPAPRAHVRPADEPEVYVQLLVAHRRFEGRGVGAALLRHAVGEARRKGVDLLRVDCYAGGDGALVAYYTGQGFAPVETFAVGEWQGQVLGRRVLTGGQV
ncbi:N-acetyltransferase family protein [Streptomyces sp. MS19]|uniref:GNAT family N-acetyltransferase n=1 Tax=Streptomyces sp. MS19 TaxID=3385972 RepID=UPI0039A1DFB0